jgi:protein involved in polysaccharide export with SLBB domain
MKTLHEATSRPGGEFCLRVHAAAQVRGPAFRALAALAVLGLTLGTPGCASHHDQMVAFLRAHEAEVATGNYIVRPPDSITVRAPGAPEVDGTTQMVRADGKVVYGLLGEIDVAGLTTEEIAGKLKQQLSRFYVDPQLVVQVTNYNSQFYYIFGEVTAPGPKRFTGRDTLLMALSDAQPTYLAWRSQVRVTRPSAEAGERKTIIVDLDKMLNSGDLSLNVLLQDGDIIEVPPTPLAWIGHRVREVLYPIEPALRAYNSPADAIRSTNTYQDELGSSDSSGSSDRWRSRFGR